MIWPFIVLSVAGYVTIALIISRIWYARASAEYLKKREEYFAQQKERGSRYFTGTLSDYATKPEKGWIWFASIGWPVTAATIAAFGIVFGVVAGFDWLFFGKDKFV